jgi:hypothetical protein
MTAIIIPALFFAIGAVAEGRTVYRQVRSLRAMHALRRTVTDKRLRRQIRLQHTAQEQVRRATTLDPWLGRGGTHLFIDA